MPRWSTRSAPLKTSDGVSANLLVRIDHRPQLIHGVIDKRSRRRFRLLDRAEIDHAADAVPMNRRNPVGSQAVRAVPAHQGADADRTAVGGGQAADVADVAAVRPGQRQRPYGHALRQL